MHEGARALAARYGCPVLLKGGHLDGGPVDLLYTGAALREFHNARVDAVNTHGSGCTLSAAIAAKLALGLALEEACAQAIAFLHEALRAPLVFADGTRLIGIER